MLFRSSSHLKTARRLADENRIIESAREYQSSIGYYAPINPFADTAVSELKLLAEEEKGRNPQLGLDIEDRLLRSIRGTKSFYQPYGKILRSQGHSS